MQSVVGSIITPCKLQFYYASGKTDLLQPMQQMKQLNKRTKGGINDFLESLVASENKFAIVERSHPVTATPRYSRCVAINDSLYLRILAESDATIQIGCNFNLGKVPTIVIPGINCISNGSKKSSFTLFALFS